MTLSPDDYSRHTMHNAEEVLSSSECCCTYCLAWFPPSEVHWAGREDTAMCPRCGIDAVIGSSSGLPIDDTQFLEGIKQTYHTPIGFGE